MVEVWRLGCTLIKPNLLTLTSKNFVGFPSVTGGIACSFLVEFSVNFYLPMQLGFVRINLAEFAGGGTKEAKLLLDSYNESKRKPDNSVIKVRPAEELVFRLQLLTLSLLSLLSLSLSLSLSPSLSPLFLR